MTREQKHKAIEKIWQKHATGRINMIATILPHPNQKAFFNEIIEWMDTITPSADPVSESRQ